MLNRLCLARRYNGSYRLEKGQVSGARNLCSDPRAANSSILEGYRTDGYSSCNLDSVIGVTSTKIKYQPAKFRKELFDDYVEGPFRFKQFKKVLQQHLIGG